MATANFIMMRCFILGLMLLAGCCSQRPKLFSMQGATAAVLGFPATSNQIYALTRDLTEQQMAALQQNDFAVDAYRPAVGAVLGSLIADNDFSYRNFEWALKRIELPNESRRKTILAIGASVERVEMTLGCMCGPYRQAVFAGLEDGL